MTNEVKQIRNREEFVQGMLDKCFKSYDSYIVSDKEKPTVEEKREVVYWDEWACNFRSSLKHLEIKEIYEYMSDGVTFKMISKEDSPFYMHFANREMVMELQS